MSRRNVYGNDWSENGWPMVDQGSCEWVTVPGTNPSVSLQIQSGWPVSILRAFVADWNAYIEHVRDEDSACWTPTNSVDTSNHLSGTAVDVCWRNHAFQVSYAGFNDAQISTMREMLSFYEDTVWWGQDWGEQGIGPFDCMHAQLNGNTFNNPHTGDFIARKIRADGYSTFRRGNAPAPLSGRDQAALLIIQTAQRRGYSRDDTIACVSTGIQESGLNQDATDSTGHRGIFQQDGGYPNREFAEGNVNGFFDRLDAKRCSPGASPDIWKNIFWLQQRPSEPTADAAFAHGRHGYLSEIQSHISVATDYVNRLGDTELDATQAQMLSDIHTALFEPRPSASKYVDDPARLWRLVDLLRIDDGRSHEVETERQALLGNPDALALVKREADKGDVAAQTVYRQCPGVKT